METGVDLFATAAKGTEGALRDELRELGLRGVRADRGGVHFSGDLSAGYRACLGSRIALRVLLTVARFRADSADALYEGVRGVDLSEHLTPRQTLAVSASCRSSALTHTQFIAQRTKDAIVDVQRDRQGARSSVDREDPDVAIFVHLVKDEACLYLDLAGESLHRRGYRTRAGEAPLKETLAAAIVRLSGWDRESPLLDPMCGSGTLLIEGALWASGVWPGTSRRTFGFERWASHDATERRAIATLRQEARDDERACPATIFGADASEDALAMTEENALAAGVDVRLRRSRVGDLPAPAAAGWLVTNPPYGARLAHDDTLPEELAALFSRLGGWKASVLAGTPDTLRALRQRPVRSLELHNGDLACRLLSYELSPAPAPPGRAAGRRPRLLSRRDRTATRRSPWRTRGACSGSRCWRSPSRSGSRRSPGRPRPACRPRRRRSTRPRGRCRTPAGC